MEEFQEVIGGQEKHGLLGSGLCFSFNINKTDTKQKAPQTHNTVPENTLDSPQPDSLCRHHLGDGFVQQLQAVQDPVAEPRAAGVQTLAQGGGENTPLIQSRPKRLLTRGCLSPCWQPGRGRRAPSEQSVNEGHSALGP